MFISLPKSFKMSSKAEGATSNSVDYKKGSKKADVVQTILSQASTALDVAGELAPLIPVPFVASIFSSAKVIVDSASVCESLNAINLLMR